MKKLIIILLILSGCMPAMAQVKNPHQIKFISHKSYSGAGDEYNTHIIIYSPGLTDDACDTLFIDNQKYFVLQICDTGEQTSPGKYNWSKQICGLKNPKSGRMVGPHEMDYDLRCYIFVGDNPSNKTAHEVFFSNHGSVVTYYK